MDLNTLSADQLAKLWTEVKSAERAINQERQDVEAALIAKLGGAREEGATTHEAGQYKVTVTGKLSYKADMPELLTLAEKLPQHLRPIKTDVKLDEAGAKYLRVNEPELWRMIAPAIEIKPAKTAVTVKDS